jgi:hypothetical protein
MCPQAFEGKGVDGAGRFVRQNGPFTDPDRHDRRGIHPGRARDGRVDVPFETGLPARADAQDGLFRQLRRQRRAEPATGARCPGTIGLAGALPPDAQRSLDRPRRPDRVATNTARCSGDRALSSGTGGRAGVTPAPHIVRKRHAGGPAANPRPR